MALRDFPAAHSMDTTWFAVDRDGRVAAFESGEAGAVPRGTGEEEATPMLRYLSTLPCDDEHRPVPRPELLGESEHRAEPGDCAILHLKRAAVVADLLNQGEAIRVASEGSEAVGVFDLDEELFARLHATGECLACENAELPLDEDDVYSVAARGLYRYEHGSDCENWISGPYHLEAKPARPMRAADLPPELREKLIRFDGSFEATPVLHPMRHWECYSWQAGWLDLDGRTARPMPGREEDFATFMADLRGNEDLVVAPALPRKPWWKLW